MLKVADKKCSQCLFSKDRIVRPGRVQDIIEQCRKNDSHFICHKGSIAGVDVVCRGFYDTQTSQVIRVAQRLNAVEFVDVDALSKPR